ncbi:MAG: hypothetical protein GX856_10795 [Gammaproteobacteria bacterium]|jgi:hypothetical protein|nr:hypothetical protein [Gammaproteobacteria bacterium]
MKLATTIAGLTLAVAAVYSVPATAQEFHANASQPAARCQAALPVFDGQIRKRPLSVQNEGTRGAFITCGFEFNAGNAVNFAPVMVDTYFYNANDADATVTCTGVTGWNGGDNEQVALELVIPSRSTDPTDGNLTWFDTDFEGGGMETSLIAISCLLPPGVGINDTYIWWEVPGEPV